ncbi:MULTISPECIES: GNAT family N-acetyltransferase [Sphingobacterium]|uniref:GNAT family N-acetyltransferase n=1 Tax=Sphingobacterium TaxID=28453 RepID=UPI0013D95B02|nr:MULTISPECIES: GNAT family protein [unclassified Sphingobacterium]
MKTEPKDQSLQERYILENERIALHTLSEIHLDDLAQFSDHEPEIWKFSLEQPTSKQKMATYIANTLQKKKEGKEHAFIVFDKQQRETAGSTRLYEIDLNQKVCSIGYTWYGKKFQGTGLNKHAKYLLLKFAFDTLHMERIQFKADNENKRSIQALLSLGCTFEGLLRSNMYRADHTRRDSAVFSSLRAEWYDHAENKLFLKLT